MQHIAVHSYGSCLHNADFPDDADYSRGSYYKGCVGTRPVSLDAALVTSFVGAVVHCLVLRAVVLLFRCIVVSLCRVLCICPGCRVS